MTGPGSASGPDSVGGAGTAYGGVGVEGVAGDAGSLAAERPAVPWSATEWSRAGWRTHLGRTAAETGRLDALIDELGAATILDLAAESARRFPDRVAVTVDGEPVTHAGLAAGASQVADWLAARTEPGDRVLLAAGSSLGFLRCYLGALQAGTVVVLANPGYTAAELGHLVADSGAVLALADPGPAAQLASLPSRGAAPLPIAPVSGVAADGDWAGAGVRQKRVVRPGDTALLAYTSGTTGRPKGVPLTHRQLAVSIRAAQAAWRWTARDVLVHALPLFHQHGLGGVHATLVAGSTAHIRSRFRAADLIGTVRAAGGTVLFGVPASYQGLLDEAAGEPLLNRLRLAVCGSAPLSPELAARLPGLLGQLPLVRYGSTESGLDVSNPLGAARADTVGLPLPGVQCRVWAPSGAAGPGADGEIQLRGPQVFGGYWADPAATAAAFTADGWFRTGDIGVVEEATGHLLIRGRSKELIISGGLNVYPREVELALESHPAVAEAAVAALPHRRWGEQVTAWVVPRPGRELSEPDLIAHARTRLAAYKCPKQVFLVAELPRNPLGKLDRRALTASHPQAR